jgi:glycosyltransferase involved in cell wall biosynthesis
MRVLFVDNCYGELGGSLVCLLQMAREMVERGKTLPASERVEPCFYFLYPNLLLDEFREIGEVVLEREDHVDYGRPLAMPASLSGIVAKLPATARRGMGEILPLALRVAGHVRRMRIDLVHANCRLGSNEYVVLGAKLARVPVVVHERFLYRLSRLTRPFAALADSIIAISDAVADNLRAQDVTPRRIDVIHDGMDCRPLSAFRDREREPGRPFRVGMVGRITRWKGQEVLVEAAGRLAGAVPGPEVSRTKRAMEFHFAGDASPWERGYLEALTETVKDKDLEQHVFFHGNVKEIYEFISSMDVLAHCSIEPEPLGHVIQEAMALGKPMVAARGGAVEEICTDGHDALVVDAARPDLLAEAIGRLARDPALARRLGENAIRTIETRFDLRDKVNQICSVYGELLAARRPFAESVREFLAGTPFSVRARRRPAAVRTVAPRA